MKSDIQICRDTNLTPIDQIARQAGILPDDLTPPQGTLKAKVKPSILKRLTDRQEGKLVLVTAITPTPLGEGKTVTTIGLAQGLAKINQSACIRQPSMGAGVWSKRRCSRRRLQPGRTNGKAQPAPYW